MLQHNAHPTKCVLRKRVMLKHNLRNVAQIAHGDLGRVNRLPTFEQFGKPIAGRVRWPVC